MKQKHIFYLFITLLVGGILYVNRSAILALLGKIKSGNGGDAGANAAGSPQNPKVSAGNGSSGTALKGTPAPRNYNKRLQQGVRGAEVTELQILLNKVNKQKKHFLLPLAEDGIFGPKTDSMLFYYANVHSITLNDAYAAIMRAYGM